MSKSFINLNNPKQRIARIAMVSFCSALLGGCAALDLLPWTRSTQERDSLEKTSSLSQDQLLVFKLPEEQATVSSKPQVSNTFPFSAPGLKISAPRLEVNHEVRRELTSYLRNNGRCISEGFARQESLFPVLAKIFRDEGLPEELLNLALIESGFRVEASSSAGAVGLWQFMAGTARLYGLEVSRRKDERRDPILSTMAAARHLKDLYSKYNDWYLVLAAYNAGEGAIDKAISGSNRPDYWTLIRSKKVMPETARFVPKFIATSILQKLYNRYGAQVQLAQYLDRHVFAVSEVGSILRYAFSLDADVSVKRG